MLPKCYCGLSHSSHIDIISSFFRFYSPNIDITILSHLPYYKISEGKVHSLLIFAFCLSHLLCNEWFSACPTTRTYWVLLKLGGEWLQPWGGARLRALRQNLIRNAPEQGRPPKGTCSLAANRPSVIPVSFLQHFGPDRKDSTFD